FCKALFMEAKWYRMRYIPSLQEYLSNASITSLGPLILMDLYFATMHELTDEIADFSHTYQHLVYNVSHIIRLCNDLATTTAERERGDIASSIACYINQMDVSEENARKHIQEIINGAWKKINGLCSTQNALMEPFFNQARNAAFHIIHIHRWDARELDELPEYMKICFNALQDVTNEIAYEVGGEKNFNMVLQCLKNTWIEFCKALFMEAKWYKMGYIPSLQEYLSNASITSSGPLILIHSYFATMHELTDEIVDFSHTYQDLVYNVSLIIRLCNDLATTTAERERGDVASSIACYINEMDVSEENARKHIQEIINGAWKKINGLFSTQNALMEPFFNQARNAARMSKGAIAGIVVGGAFGILLLALILYVVFYRRKKVAQVTLLPVPGCGSSLDKASESTTIASPRLTGITVDKSVEFSYEELAKATDGFSAANIIGRGGFGSIYYAELRNEVCFGLSVNQFLLLLLYLFLFLE
ncbi:hypothetical protein RYX36_016971, partial [Vicia faba]